MILNIDTSQPLTLTDRTILAALLNGSGTTSGNITYVSGVSVVGAGETVDPKVEESKPEPRKRTSRPKTAEPAEEPTDGNPMAEAVRRASALLSDNKADVVRAALAEAGAKRVGELTDEQVPAFLAALDAA